MRMLILFLILLVSAVYDVKTQKIPNIFAAIAAVLAMLMNFENAFYGGICVGLPLLFAACVTEQIGGGDVKLMTAAAMNLNGFLGVIFAVLTLILAYIFSKITKKSDVPLAPFMCAGFFAAILIERLM